MFNCHLFSMVADGGSRGGVFEGEDPILEIGDGAICTSEVMALVAHLPEIMEYLKMKEDNISNLILASMKNEEGRLDVQYRSHKNENKTAEESANIIGRMRESDRD